MKHPKTLALFGNSFSPHTKLVTIILTATKENLAQKIFGELTQAAEGFKGYCGSIFTSSHWFSDSWLLR